MKARWSVPRTVTAYPEGYRLKPAQSVIRRCIRHRYDYHRCVPSSQERREALKAVYEQARTCVRCSELAATRQTVVFGAGNADADLMFVGEAPGANEDKQGLPFVGQAGKLLDKLLGEIGLERGDVFIANVLRCRPPGNRDPRPEEIENCQEYLLRTVELIEPRVICTLGNFSTKLLRGDPAGITRVHGQPEVRPIGRCAVRLYPIYHPAAALYTPRMLETLREDFSRLPALLALAAPVLDAPALHEHPEPVDEAPPEPEAPITETEPEPALVPTAPGAPDAPQLGLF
jgi:DNA polymerase